MALCHPSFACTCKPTFSPCKFSHFRRNNQKLKTEFGTAHQNKTCFNVVMKQIANLVESRKFEDDVDVKHAKALEGVKHILINKVRKNSVESLSMIDMIQRLGIEYHFEQEIKAAIQKPHMMFTTNKYGSSSSSTSSTNDHFDLSEVALQFRLLRQEGHFAHSDVFDNFMDNKGRLKQEFCRNLEGLMGLFEASQLSIVGENLLHEAGDLSHKLLKELLSKCKDHSEANVVAKTLQHPIHKNLPRFIPFRLQNSQATKEWSSALQEISKIDAHFVNTTHLKEIFAVSKWWRDLGLAKELKFARDEAIQWYMWPMACFTDPRLSEERIELTKPLSLVYIIDDIFDICGSMDELTLFTDAVNRWDLEAMEQLPDYMKICFKALYDITNEFAYKVQKKHGWNPINGLVKSWVRLCNAFMEEAKWLSSEQLPPTEEYMKNGLVSTGAHVVFVHAFFLLGEGINKETVAIMDDFPTLISSIASILRLYDDLEGAKDDFFDGSYLKCYMKEHARVSEGETREHVIKMISSAWKRLNQEFLSPSNPFPLTFNKICLNGARMVPLMYSYADSKQTRMRLEEHVKSLLFDSSSMQVSINV